MHPTLSRTVRVAGYLFCLVMGMVIGRSDAQDDAAAQPDEKKKEIDSVTRAKLLKTFHDEFVEITPGRGKFPKSFRMGHGKTAHDVAVGHDFAIAKYEVPQNLYEAVMGANPSVWGGARNSVEMMTWHEANDFCKRATMKMRKAGLLERDEEIRLPSEAEWEYCCRAGTKTAYSFGDEAAVGDDPEPKASLLDPYGWHTGNAAGNDPPVGALKSNAWGLYDMHGYLWEYVSDAYSPDFKDAPTDGSPREPQRKYVDRVIRGGSWRDHYRRLTSDSRASIPDHVRSDAIGFRCVKAKVAAPNAKKQ